MWSLSYFWHKAGAPHHAPHIRRRAFAWSRLFAEDALVLLDAAASFLPVPPAATPVSTAAKQQHHNNDNEDQFHRKSPVMVMTSNRELPAVN
jgi:hypothetical protein